MAWGIALSHDGLAKRTFLYALATFVCVCTNVNVEGKVPVIKVSKPAPERGLLSTIFGSAASTKSNSENDGEILDVTMAKYGHHLAFHVIHPEIGEDGSIKPVTGQQDFIVADEDGTITSSKEDSMERKKDIQQQSAPKSDPRKCISWRQTGNCSPEGPRESEKDVPCNIAVHSGQSGFCECENNRRVRLSTCEHETFICENECTGKHVVVPRDYHDIKEYFEKSKLFEESKPRSINQQLAKNRPFFLFILCDCENDLLNLQHNGTNNILEASFPLAQFEANIRKKQLENKFSFLYALPQAAKAFSLHEQYAKIRGTPLDKDKPWLVIDNIPNGAMNEKFLFSGNVPGMTAADLMKMITQYLEYKLPLLVRSAPTPGFSIMTGDSRGRRMRGASSISHTVDVVSDTFQEIVLNTTHTCFLLIYSPNCPASRNVLPILDRVALRIKDLKNVTIAKMDLTKTICQ